MCRQWRSASGGVYPRVCGGTRTAVFPALTLRGLSPRVRGNPVLVAVNLAPSMSIPACAGEPVNLQHCAVVYGVYPRVCGGTTLNAL